MKQLNIYRHIFLVLIIVLPHLCQAQQVWPVNNKGTVVTEGSKWYLLGQNIYNKNSGNVGINTTTPLANLHVNGFTIINTLPVITTATKNVVTDPTTKNLAQQNIDVFAPIVGDIKYSAQSTDHSGWVLLDGRNTGSLSSAQQANAAGLGFAGTLPDATNALPVDNGETLGSITGSTTAVMAQSNLPDFNFTGTTNTTGSHTHTLYNLTGSVNVGRSGGSAGARAGANTAAAGDHRHAVEFNTGGSDAPFSIMPKTLSANAFVYLGL